MKKCLRCGYEWETKIDNPRFCPNCNSPYWDKAKKNVSKQDVESLVSLVKDCHDKSMDANEDKGVRDDGGLYNCAYNIISYENNFPNDFAGITITIINEIAKKGHFFVDGNKRTGFVTAKTYLLTRGYLLEIPEIEPTDRFIRELVSYNSKISFNKARSWIKKYIKKNRKNLRDYIIDLILGEKQK